MKAKNMKLQDETAQDFDNLFNELSEQSEEKLTVSAFLDELIENYRNPRRDSGVRAELEKLKTESAANIELIGKIAQMYETTPDELLKTAEAYKQHYLKLAKSIDEKQSELDELKNQLTESKTHNEEHSARYAELEAETQKLRGRLKSTDVVVQAGQAHTLLMEILNRLSKKYGRETTGGEMLLKIFLCYFIENRSEWYYPINIVSNAEIEQLTGISVKDWRKFLSNANNNQK